MYNKMKFELTTNTGIHSVSPCYTDKATLQYAKESNLNIIREKLKVELVFQRAEYDLIMSCPFDYIFSIRVEVFGKIIEQYFTRVDCDIDEDARKIVVTPLSDDLYTDFLNNINKEFNILDLSPKKTSITIKERPIIQVYKLGNDYITNIVGGASWDTRSSKLDDNTTDISTLTNDMHFTGGFDNNMAFAVIKGENLNPDISGHYVNGTRLDGHYHIGTTPQNTIVVVDLIGVWAGFPSVYEQPLGTASGVVESALVPTVYTGAGVADFTLSAYFCRILTNKADMNGTPTLELPEVDIVEKGRYLRALPYEHKGFSLYMKNSPDPQGWGKIKEESINYGGNYFVKPVLSGVSIPVARTTWNIASEWFYFTPEIQAIQDDNTEDYIIEDAYKLSDILSVLTPRLDPLISHSEFIDSDFIYGITTIRGNAKIPVIIPKTNLLTKNYDTPANRLMLRMSDMMQLLKNFHKCDWYLDPIGKESTLKFEHEEFFRNGRSYDSVNIGFDATTKIVPSHKKNWAYKTSKYKFDKFQIPERIKWTWQDDVSNVFNGFGIECLSNYVEKGREEVLNISRFTSDIDFMHVKQNQITKDGFIFIEAIEDDNLDLICPIPEVDIGGEIYKLNNGYASIAYANEQYGKYNLPCSSVKINNVVQNGKTVRRNKTQIITLSEKDINPNRLVKTFLGAGNIEKMDIGVNSEKATITIKHDTE